MEVLYDEAPFKIVRVSTAESGVSWHIYRQGELRFLFAPDSAYLTDWEGKVVGMPNALLAVLRRPILREGISDFGLRRKLCSATEMVAWCMESPMRAYLYALQVVQGPWPVGEAIIAQSAEASYGYAYDVLKGRFPAGEPVLATSAEWATRYELEICKGRNESAPP